MSSIAIKATAISTSLHQNQPFKTTVKTLLLVIPLILLSIFSSAQSMTLSVDGVNDGLYCLPSTSSQLTITLRIAPTECPNALYTIDWGDGSEPQETSALTVRHVFDLRTFQQATAVSRFPVTISVSSEACGSSFYEFVFVKAPRAAATVQTSCSGAPVAFINNSIPQGENGISYKWEFSDGQTSTDFSPFLRFEKDGTYKLTVTTPSCGSHTVSGNFALRPLPEANFEAIGFTQKEDDLVVCYSDSAVLTLDGGVSKNHNAYTWSISGGAYDRLSPNLTSRMAKINLKEEKEYTVTLSVRNTACITSQTSISRTFKVVKDDVPKLTPQPDACQPIQYRVPVVVNNAQYTINGVAFDPNNVQPLGFSAQPYIVRATLNNTCGNQAIADTFMIQQIQPVSILTEEKSIGVCVNSDPLTFQTNTTDGTWKGGGVLEDNQLIFTPSQIGTFELVYYKGAGVCYVADTVTVRVNTTNLNAIKFTPSTLEGCGSASVSFKVNENENKNYLYEWDFGNGQTAIGYAPSAQVFENATSETQAFFPRLTVFNGCVRQTSNQKIEVHAETKALMGIDSTTIRCNASPILFSNRSIGHTKNKSIWDFGDGTQRVTESDTVYHLFPNTDKNTYTIKLKVEGACGTDETSMEVRVAPEVHALFTMPESVCPGESITFQDATVPLPDRWVWTFGDGNVSNEANPTHAFTQANREYKVTLTAYTACGSDTISRIVKTSIAPEANFDFSAEASCQGSDITFLNTSNPQLNFLWNFGDGNVDSVNYSPVHRYDSEGIKEVTLQVYADRKSCMNTFKKAIRINPELRIDYQIASEGTICAPGPVVIKNLTQNANQYEWYFNDLLVTDVENPAVPLPNGIYTVKLVASYNGFCRDSLELPMALTLEPCELQIPEAFTPNNDKFGDYYTFFGSGIQKINFLKVRNRWGEVIFEMFDVPAGSQQADEAWDGTIKGTPAPADTYVYEAEVTYIDNSVSDRLRGNFYLIR